MRLTYGYSGWIRVEELDGVTGRLYLHLAVDNSGRWRTHELYLDGDRPLTPGMLRRLPLGPIEAFAQRGDGSDYLERRMSRPGPQLSVMAETYDTWYVNERPNCESCGGLVDPVARRSLSWVETCWWAQYDDIKVTRPRRRKPVERPDPGPVEPLSAPERLTKDFLEHVAAAYDAAVSSGIKAPAKTLGAQAGVSPRTVHRWVYTARKRGIMAPGKQGSVG